MNKSILFAATAIAAACAFAQEGNNDQRGPGGRPPKKQMQAITPNAGMWIPKMLSDKETLAGIGVSDEEAAAKIAADMAAFESRGNELERQIRDLSREQAKLFHNLIKDRNADQKPVMEMIDKIANLRAEQGRLALEALLALRDSLSPEQLKLALALVHERGYERHRMRNGPENGEPPFAPPRGMRDGRRGPDGKRGEGRRMRPDRGREGPLDGVPPPPAEESDSAEE